MRRKLGILFLIGITVLAGTQEATRQFDGLKSSLKNFTRASLWSGLIVYAQPVNDGKLPTPQIYYLMPTPQQQPAAQQPVLADSNGATAPKPEARNNHGGEAASAATVASNPDATMLAEAARVAEDAAKSELALNNLPLNLISSHLVAPKAEKMRVYEEVAKHETHAARNETHAARKFRREADAIARVFVKEVEPAKLVAEAGRLVALEAPELEHLKLKTLGELENLHRRMELRVARRPARPERQERIRIVVPRVETRGMALIGMSSIGCEKTRVTPAPAPAPATPFAMTTAPQALAEPPVELGLPAASNASGNSWSLNCDTEPEQK